MDERHIFEHGDLAISYGIAHIRGVAKDGKTMGARMRNTACLRKTNGRWLITHEHNSIPLDKETGVGMMDLDRDGVTPSSCTVRPRRNG